MKKLTAEKVFKIPDFKIVTVTKMNHITEVQSMEKVNCNQTIKRLPNNEYVVLSTGEIREFENKSKNRSENINSLYQTLKKLRYLINNNFVGADNELFITLTYAENMQDTERLYSDLDKFYKRLRYKYRDITSIDYLNVIEPQRRGAWHCHMLMRFNDLDKIFIPNNELAEIWGHGFTNTKSIKEIDNIGAYLTAYLTDMKIEEVDRDYLNKYNINSCEFKNSCEIKTVDDKMFVKGARLYMYPPGVNLYRCSRGIKKPKREKMSYKKAKKYVGVSAPTYQGKIKIETEDFENTIIYEYYNTKRG